MNDFIDKDEERTVFLLNGDTVLPCRSCCNKITDQYFALFLHKIK